MIKKKTYINTQYKPPPIKKIINKNIILLLYINTLKTISNSEKKLKEGGQPILQILRKNHQKEKTGIIIKLPRIIKMLRLPKNS